jgi:hypothetical protein
MFSYQGSGRRPDTCGQKEAQTAWYNLNRRERFYDDVMSPETIATYLSLMQRARHFCPILSKVGVSRSIFIPIPNTKFHGNRSVGAVLINSDGRTDVTKVSGPIRDFTNGLKRKFLARRRHTSFELQRALKILGGGIFVVDGEKYIKRVNRPTPVRISSFLKC